MDWTDIGHRVRESRLAAGLAQADLARELGLDRTMVVKIEAGSRRIDAMELARLSSVLGVPLDHFLRSRPTVLSRRAQLVDDTDTDAARRSYLLETKLLEWLRDVRQLVEDGILELPEVAPCPFRFESEQDARKAALWLREEQGIGAEPIRTLMEVCERAGQSMLVTDLPGEGASVVDDGVAVAVVSRTGDPGRRRATAAHELGHFVIGDEYSSDLGVAASREERERSIDAFAAELLLPTNVISREWGSEAVDDRERLIGLAAVYRTSWSVAVSQALQAEVIDSGVARKWRSSNPTHAEFMEALGWTPQADLDSVRVPPRYAHAVIEAWKSNRISSARAVELMHGQISERDLPDRDDSALTP